MKITILCPKTEFTSDQRKRLSALGEVVYTDSRKEYPLAQLIEMSKDAEILAFDPDNIGGFEVAPERLLKLLDAMPKVKGLALDTTAFGYVDLLYCKKRRILVMNVPHYSSESVAEQVLGFLLGMSKRIFLTDRKTQRNQYELVQGHELKGKTLGVIGLGSIGQRVAELGEAVGMKVIAWNRSPKKAALFVSLDELLAQADYISINLAENKDTHNFLSKERIQKLKTGVMIVNTADRSLIDETAMAEALKSGQVDSYALEAEDLTSPPLGGIQNAFLFKGFGWYTKEALERNKEIWIENIVALTKGKVINNVN